MSNIVKIYQFDTDTVYDTMFPASILEQYWILLWLMLTVWN